MRFIVWSVGNTREIKLTRGQSAIVDADDYAELSKFKWCANWSPFGFYAIRRIRLPNGKWTVEYMHRRILGLQPGDKRVVDHRNHNGLDDRRKNLRIINGSQNQMNGRRPRHNTSGYKGVCFDKRSKKWMASIQTSGKQKTLGYFNTAEAANEAVRKARAELHGEFACYDRRAYNGPQISKLTLANRPIMH
jgi:AP2 domain